MTANLEIDPDAARANLTEATAFMQTTKTNSSGASERLARLRDKQAADERAEFEAWLDASKRLSVYPDWSPALACARMPEWPEGPVQIFLEQ